MTLNFRRTLVLFLCLGPTVGSALRTTGGHEHHQHHEHHEDHEHDDAGSPSHDHHKHHHEDHHHDHDSHDAVDDSDCLCGRLPPRPDVGDHLAVARWMVHGLNQGVLSTISTQSDTAGFPFGNVYSFVDGPCETSTGLPYFYASPLDQSAKDATADPRVSLTLTEAALPAACRKDEAQFCTATTHGDPESPTCARLVLSGSWVVLDRTSDEWTSARTALFERHPFMSLWPTNHHWQVVQLEIQSLWFLDTFGGAFALDVEAYRHFVWPPLVEEAH